MDDGTVRDNKTGLIWLKDANCFGSGSWETSMGSASSLSDGQCGLTDGSSVGDWRLPTKEEWEAFVDTKYFNPALCNAAGWDQWSEGDAFNNIALSNAYWSSTESENPNYSAWGGSIITGETNKWGKMSLWYVWTVRVGN